MRSSKYHFWFTVLFFAIISLSDNFFPYWCISLSPDGSHWTSLPPYPVPLPVPMLILQDSHRYNTLWHRVCINFYLVWIVSFSFLSSSYLSVGLSGWCWAQSWSQWLLTHSSNWKKSRIKYEKFWCFLPMHLTPTVSILIFISCFISQAPDNKIMLKILSALV